MGFLVGPCPGELAKGDGTFARVNAEELGSPVPALFIDRSEFPNPEEFGLLTAAQNPSKAWVVLDTVAVDISSRHKVDIYDIRNLPDSNKWEADKVVKIGGTVFRNAHPEQWWSDVHDKTGRIFLAVGELRRHLEPGNRVGVEFKKGAYVGLCSLVVRWYESGIGTRPQS
jgi:hypothetical protein